MVKESTFSYCSYCGLLKEAVYWLEVEDVWNVGEYRLLRTRQNSSNHWRENRSWFVCGDLVDGRVTVCEACLVRNGLKW